MLDELEEGWKSQSLLVMIMKALCHTDASLMDKSVVTPTKADEGHVGELANAKNAVRKGLACSALMLVLTAIRALAAARGIQVWAGPAVAG